jgi:UV DNA damage endonuclease
MLKNANLKGRVELEKIVLANLQDTLTILRWNEDHGIRNFRISSVVFPHYTNPALEYRYNMDFAQRELRALGDYARKYNHRLSTHPDHYSYMIASPVPRVVEQAVADLHMHSEMLSKIGLGDDSVMTIHGPSPYGDKRLSWARWEDQFRRLPDSLRNRIVLENDEWHNGVNDILPVCERLGIPMVFDWFHNSVSSSRVEVDDALLVRILDTWRRRSIRPLMHYSEQEPGGRKGHHSFGLAEVPQMLLTIPSRFGVNIDVDFETKSKEASVLDMYKKYFDETRVDGRLFWRLKKEYSV